MKKKLIRKRKNLSQTETYWVKIDRKRDDGYWNCNEMIYVNIKCEPHEDPKNLREKAIKQALYEYPGCRIVSCSYV